MRLIGLTLGALLLLAAIPALHAAETVTLRGEDVLTALEEEVSVPAQEAGVLVNIAVREGQQVAVGDPLAQIDNVVPMAKRNVAFYKFKVAEEQASNDVDVRYAELGYDVASTTYEKSLEANRRTPRVISEVDVNQQRLDRDKFKLMWEKAKRDMIIAGWQAKVAEAEYQAAEADLQRRKIISPLDAVVVELKSHVGDWVQQGDTVMRLVRVDRLRVEGKLSAKEHLSSEIMDRPVSVVVEFAKGRRETFQGKIVYVAPEVKVGLFKVRAEVQNRKQNGLWVLSPGLPAEMTIQLK